MPLNEITSRLVAMGQRADKLCRALPHQHRFATGLRDFANQIEQGAKALSKSTLEAIAGD
jgi:hypothetical protein